MSNEEPLDENTASGASDPSALSYEDAAAENARAQAEARRRRILEKADKRLGVVSGEQPIEETEKKSSASNAARIRAARARRYGKKGGTDPTAPAGSGTPESPDPSATDTTSSGSSSSNIIITGGATSAETAPKLVEEAVASPVTPAETTSGSETKEPDEPPETPAVQSEEGEQVLTSKKKYQGVAKMRRKMIAKKKMEESEETSGVPSSGTNMSVTATVPPKKVAVLPVCMHIATVLLLYGAGFDVGFQQFHEDIQIHTRSAVQEYGIPFVHRQPWKPLTQLVSKSDGIHALEEKYPSQLGKDLDVDEFQEVEEENVPIIDPLFGIDLDELTKGPGVLNQLARGAIAIHRSILWIAYLTPLAIFNSLIAIPLALIRMPPVLCVVAILMRQVVGKAILGAAIPEAGADGNSDGGNNIEVISMAMNFIKTSMMTAFPTLMALYDAFTHLRTDMYIVLCGVFCGLAWTHLNVPVTDPTAAVGGKDEL
jgi:hypothetical protein